ncbi:MAG: hypothetical protein ABMB14_21575 [Myxococcota bacterium]
MIALYTLGAAALACPVCSDPNDPSANAYFSSTMFLSFLPLIAMGVVALWLYRAYTAPDLAPHG